MRHSWCIVMQPAESASSSCLQSLYKVFSLLFCGSQHKSIPCYSMLFFITAFYGRMAVSDAVSGVFKNGIARKHENGTVLWQPKMQNGSYAEPYRFKPFGTTKVEVDGILQDRIDIVVSGKAWKRTRSWGTSIFIHFYTTHFAVHQATIQSQILVILSIGCTFSPSKRPGMHSLSLPICRENSWERSPWWQWNQLAMCTREMYMWDHDWIMWVCLKMEYIPRTFPFTVAGREWWRMGYYMILYDGMNVFVYAILNQCDYTGFVWILEEHWKSKWLR